MQDREERLLAYYSKRLEESSKSLTATEMEMKGITICVLAFSHILKSAALEMYCDHREIPHILRSTCEIPTKKLQRFFDKLSSYTFKIGWKAGKSRKVADWLSRKAQTQEDYSEGIIPIAFQSMEIPPDMYSGSDRGFLEWAFPATDAGRCSKYHSI